MLLILLMVTTAICAGGWFFTGLAMGGVVRFIKKKGYTPPTQAELAVCVREYVAWRFSKKP